MTVESQRSEFPFNGRNYFGWKVPCSLRHSVQLVLLFNFYPLVRGRRQKAGVGGGSRFGVVSSAGLRVLLKEGKGGEHPNSSVLTGVNIPYDD